MNTIKWGIIGCGDVTEIKSGPAFNKVNNSALIAVMRRDAVKAKDYSVRHNVPKWYTDANELINDSEVNAIYIATPPSSHAAHAIAAINAGKPVYVEKPMCLNAKEASMMASFAKEKNVKMVVAHYRREHAIFKKIKQLLDEKIIGEVRLATIEFFRKSLKNNKGKLDQSIWRIDPAISGGGLFHDMAPHQLDLMYYFFGPIKQMGGIAINQASLYKADDLVTGNVVFDSGVVVNGIWSFSVADNLEKDHCEIIGTEGKMSFSIFEGNTITISKTGWDEVLHFESLQHVQLPMIKKVVEYFLDQDVNPCSGEDGLVVMKMLDAFTKG